MPQPILRPDFHHSARGLAFAGARTEEKTLAERHFLCLTVAAKLAGSREAARVAPDHIPQLRSK
jgi:hypothetical protein